VNNSIGFQYGNDFHLNNNIFYNNWSGYDLAKSFSYDFDFYKGIKSGIHNYYGGKDIFPFEFIKNVLYDPFVNVNDPDGADNIFGTADDGLVPKANSTIRNGGNSTSYSTTDIIGNPRVVGCFVDAGAYESQIVDPPLGSIVYVNPNATGTKDGSSWSNGFLSLENALRNVQECGAGTVQEVWVKSGIHSPGNGDKYTFVIPQGIKLLGGFAGTETLASQRDWNANQTTLEGNSRIAYKSSILINVLGDNAAIDGFIISGSVDALVVENKNNISVSNCKFVNNNVGTKITNSSITFENSFFLNNNAYSGLLILNSNSNVTTT